MKSVRGPPSSWVLLENQSQLTSLVIDSIKVLTQTYNTTKTGKHSLNSFIGEI